MKRIGRPSRSRTRMVRRLMGAIEPSLRTYSFSYSSEKPRCITCVSMISASPARHFSGVRSW